MQWAAAWLPHVLELILNVLWHACEMMHRSPEAPSCVNGCPSWAFSPCRVTPATLFSGMGGKIGDGVVMFGTTW